MQTILDFSKKNSIYLLCGIFIFSLILRFYHFDETIPVTMDALQTFHYAADISTIGRLPENYDIAKPSWSIFLGGIFSLFDFENTLSYMQLQKISAIIISSLSVFPLYLLIRKFSQRKYSLLGVLLFGCEPRLIENSIVGGPESIFIICIITTMLFFLSSNKKLVYISFITAGIATCFRPEGLPLFFGITIMFFVKFRKDRLVFPKYLIAITLFILVMIPISIHQEEIGMHDSFVLKPYTIINSYFELENNTTEKVEVQEISGINPVFVSIENFIKYFGWVLIPMFILLVPPGFIIFLKNIDMKKITVIIVGICLSIPAFYAYSFPLLETKYLYFLFPVFCIFSTFSIKYFVENFSLKKITFPICIILIVITSIAFIDLQFEFKDNKESAIIAQFVVENTSAINNYYPESQYVWGYDVPKKWEEYKIFYENMNRVRIDIQAELRGLDEIGGGELVNTRMVWIQEASSFSSLESFLQNPTKEKMSHLVVDDKNNRPEFLKDIFYNEEKYMFLKKIYDSKNDNFQNHVKIFEINYQTIEDQKNSSDNTYTNLQD